MYYYGDCEIHRLLPPGFRSDEEINTKPQGSCGNIDQSRNFKGNTLYYMEEFLEIAEKNYATARMIIKDLQIREIWNEFNYKAHLVGSVKTKLIMLNRDVDFHVYSDFFEFERSFRAIAKISGNSRIKRFSCYNFLNDYDKSLDWHLHYLDGDEKDWRIDIIQLLNDSPYAGKAEKAADDINTIMSDNIRETILKIKYDAVTEKIDFSGIEVYKAVIEGRVTSLDEFRIWKENRHKEQRDLWKIEIQRS